VYKGNLQTFLIPFFCVNLLCTYR